MLSAIAFDQAFQRFFAHVQSKDGQSFRGINFQSGFLFNTEFYKTEIRKKALDTLAFSDWRDNWVGTGKILASVINAIEMEAPFNNLVQWQESRRGLDACSHAALRKAQLDQRQWMRIESLFFDFYHDHLEPDEVMAELIELVGKRFDLVSYLFFIKDWEQFMPIVPTYFEKAFKLLRVESDGVPLRLSMNCSWETYRACNDALMQIQQYLMDLDVPRVRLIDAHTFCWITSRLEPENPSEKAVTDATAAVELNSPPSVQIELSKEHDDPVEVDWEAVTKLRAFLGCLGEEHALNFERTRLVTLGKNELAEKVAIVSSDHRLGYDIRSFESDGTLRYIEVKVVRVNETDTSFFLTSNELEQSRQHENYWLYLVSHVRSSNCVIRTMHSKEMNKEWLSPIIYKVAMPLPDRMLEHSGGNN